MRHVGQTSLGSGVLRHCSRRYCLGERDGRRDGRRVIYVAVKRGVGVNAKCFNESGRQKNRGKCEENWKMTIKCWEAYFYALWRGGDRDAYEIGLSSYAVIVQHVPTMLISCGSRREPAYFPSRSVVTKRILHTHNTLLLIIYNEFCNKFPNHSW